MATLSLKISNINVLITPEKHNSHMAAGKGKVIRNITLIICTCNIYGLHNLPACSGTQWRYGSSASPQSNWGSSWWSGHCTSGWAPWWSRWQDCQLSLSPLLILLQRVGGWGTGLGIICAWATIHHFSVILPHGTNLTCVNDGWEARQVDQQRGRTLLSLPVKLVGGLTKNLAEKGVPFCWLFHMISCWLQIRIVKIKLN